MADDFPEDRVDRHRLDLQPDACAVADQIHHRENAQKPPTALGEEQALVRTPVRAFHGSAACFLKLAALRMPRLAEFAGWAFGKHCLPVAEEGSPLGKGAAELAPDCFAWAVRARRPYVHSQDDRPAPRRAGPCES